MNSRIVGLRVAGVVFGLVALAQLLRLVTEVEVLVAGYLVPLWPNAVAFFVASGLSFWMWRLSYRGTISRIGLGYADAFASSAHCLQARRSSR